VLPSQTNFLLVRPPVLAARTWLERLRDRRILVRWFDTPELRDALRITVGTDREAAALVRAARQILRDARRSAPAPATPVRRATRGRARR